MCFIQGGRGTWFTRMLMSIKSLGAAPKAKAVGSFRSKEARMYLGLRSGPVAGADVALLAGKAFKRVLGQRGQVEPMGFGEWGVRNEVWFGHDFRCSMRQQSSQIVFIGRGEGLRSWVSINCLFG